MSELRTALRRRWLLSILILVALIAPLLLPTFWLDLGALVLATSVGAIGLMLLFGRVGQLSLGQPFFLAIGAYGYVWLASPTDGKFLGLGLPSALAMIIAAVLAGVVGLLLSPISGRLKGLSLGLATLSLVFIGQWLLFTAESLTGGYNGRPSPVLQIGPLSSSGSNLALLGKPIGGSQFMWYVTLFVLIAVAAFTATLLRGRTGRAFTAIREAEVHASALGVHVSRYRAVAFALSSTYAGLCGALLAVLVSFVVPEYFGLMLAMSYLAMVVIGGLRSVTGAILGAAFVTIVPALLQRYGSDLPGLAAKGSDGITPDVAGELIYGAALIAVLMIEPAGLAAIPGRIRNARSGSTSGSKTTKVGTHRAKPTDSQQVSPDSNDPTTPRQVDEETADFAGHEAGK